MNRTRHIALFLLCLLSARVLVAGKVHAPAGQVDGGAQARCRMLPERALSCCSVPLAADGDARDCDCDLRNVETAYLPLQRNPGPCPVAFPTSTPTGSPDFRDAEALKIFVPNPGTSPGGPPRARLQCWQC